MSIGANIRRIRSNHDLTQEEFGKIAGVSAMAVSQWENGRAVPRMGAVQRISDALGVPKISIIGAEEDTNRGIVPLPIKTAKTARVPLRGKVHAGTPVEPETYDQEYVDIPSRLLEEDPDAYAAIAEGDCMNLIYPEGCVIVVSPRKKPKNGSVAVVTIDGSDAVMREMYQTQDTLVLSPKSSNPEHKDIVIRSDDDHIVEFGGKVVWFQARTEME
ncbi:LexA family transcriptional regulator [uncultured Slackia sp.]|uniref:LexA family protein n=1 Tax=uncultured Slackia sp. TaxID=665903 RepID=UPI0026DF8D53|nr:XRE family transcriptional regulator [uncultured Slackia sp.]